jgi:hypothetical protein
MQERLLVDKFLPSGLRKQVETVLSGVSGMFGVAYDCASSQSPISTTVNAVNATLGC